MIHLNLGNPYKLIIRLIRIIIPPIKSENPVTNKIIARFIQYCGKTRNPNPIHHIPELKTIIPTERIPFLCDKRIKHDANKKRINTG